MASAQCVEIDEALIDSLFVRPLAIHTAFWSVTKSSLLRLTYNRINATLSQYGGRIMSPLGL